MTDSTSLPRGGVLTAALVAPLAVAALLSSVRDSVTAATAVLLLVLLVVAAAATGDRLAGLAAAVSSAAWFDFFLTEPYRSFAIDDPDDIEVAVLLVLIGAGVCELALWGRRQQRRASERAAYLDGIMQTAASVSRPDRSRDVVSREVADRIAEVLGAASCRFEPGSRHDARDAVLYPDGGLVRQGRQLDPDQDGLPTDGRTVVPVQRGGQVLGRFVVTSAAHTARPSREQRQVACLLADSAAAAAEQSDAPRSGEAPGASG